MYKWLLVWFAVVVFASSGALANYWLTYYERSGFLETPRYEQTVEFCQKLVEYSADLRFASFGISHSRAGLSETCRIIGQESSA